LNKFSVAFKGTANFSTPEKSNLYLKLSLFQTFSPTSGCLIRSLREWNWI